MNSKLLNDTMVTAIGVVGPTALSQHATKAVTQAMDSATVVKQHLPDNHIKYLRQNTVRNLSFSMTQGYSEPGALEFAQQAILGSRLESELNLAKLTYDTLFIDASLPDIKKYGGFSAAKFLVAGEPSDLFKNNPGLLHKYPANKSHVVRANDGIPDMPNTRNSHSSRVVLSSRWALRMGPDALIQAMIKHSAIVGYAMVPVFYDLMFDMPPSDIYEPGSYSIPASAMPRWLNGSGQIPHWACKPNYPSEGSLATFLGLTERNVIIRTFDIKGVHGSEMKHEGVSSAWDEWLWCRGGKHYHTCVGNFEATALENIGHWTLFRLTRYAYPVLKQITVRVPEHLIGAKVLKFSDSVWRYNGKKKNQLFYHVVPRSLVKALRDYAVSAPFKAMDTSTMGFPETMTHLATAFRAKVSTINFTSNVPEVALTITDDVISDLTLSVALELRIRRDFAAAVRSHGDSGLRAMIQGVLQSVLELTQIADILEFFSKSSWQDILFPPVIDSLSSMISTGDTQFIFSTAADEPESLESECGSDEELDKLLDEALSEEVSSECRFDSEDSSQVGDIKASDIIHERAARLGMKVVRVKGDGNCFYRALAVCMGRPEDEYLDVKTQLIAGLQTLPKFIPGTAIGWDALCAPESWDDWVNRMAKAGEWADNVVIQAAAHIFNAMITIVTDKYAGGTLRKYSLTYSGEIMGDDYHIAHVDGNHYDAMVTNTGQDPQEPVEPAPVVEVFPEWTKGYIDRSAASAKRFTWKMQDGKLIGTDIRGREHVVHQAIRPELGVVDECKREWGTEDFIVQNDPILCVATNSDPWNRIPLAVEMRAYKLPNSAKKWFDKSYGTDRRKCAEPPVEGMRSLCDMAHRHGIPQMMCRHRPYESVKFELSSREVEAWSAILMNDAKVAAKIAILNSAANKVLIGAHMTSNQHGISYSVPTAVIEAGAGCGKTHFMKALGREMAWKGISVGFYLPTSALVAEYGSYILPGAKVPKRYNTFTTHYGLFANAGDGKTTIGAATPLDVLIIDEAWKMPAEFIVLTLFVRKPKFLILVGDTAQTHTRVEHGKPLKDFFPNLDNHNVHQMLCNFRNPSSIVDTVNTLILNPVGRCMVAMSKIKGENNVIRITSANANEDPISSVLYKDEKGAPVDFFRMSFDNATSALASNEVPDYIDPGNLHNTVTSAQGLTKDCVKIMLSKHSFGLMRQPAQLYVALTRHRKEILWVLIEASNDEFGSLSQAAQTYGARALLDTYHKLALMGPGGFTPSYRRVPASFPEGEVVAESYRPLQDAAYVLVDQFPSVDLYTHVNTEARYSSTNKSLRYFEQPEIMGLPSTANGSLLMETEPRRQMGYVCNALYQGENTVEASRTGLGRYNQQRSPMNMDAAASAKLNVYINKFLSETKDPEKLEALRTNEAAFADVRSKFLRDLRDRKIIKQWEGEMDWEAYIPLSVATPDGLISVFKKPGVMMRQKSGIKMVNNTKDFSPNKLGQGITRFSPEMFINFGLLLRWLNFLDLNSNRRSSTTFIVEHNGRNPDEVAAELQRIISDNSMLLEAKVSDFVEADAGFKQINHELVRKVYAYLEPRLTAFINMFDWATTELEIKVPRGVKFRSRYENLSGHPATLSKTSINNKFVNWCSHTSPSFRVLSAVGDDGLQAGVDLKMDDEFMHFWNSYTTMQMKFYDLRSGPAEFVGHVVRLSGKNLQFTPALVRRVERIISRPWKNYSEFALVQESIRDYFDKYWSRRTEILEVAAQLLLEKFTLSDANAMNLAESYWDGLLSLGHVNARQFNELTKAVRLRIAPPRQ